MSNCNISESLFTSVLLNDEAFGGSQRFLSTICSIHIEKYSVL